MKFGKGLTLSLRLVMAVLVVAIAAVIWRVSAEKVKRSKTLRVPKYEVPGQGALAGDASAGVDSAFLAIRLLDFADLPVAERLDHPLGSENAAFSYNAQVFGENNHLGDDLNGIGGQDSDLGDPVFCVGDGRVVYTGAPSPGWGNVVIVAHVTGPERRIMQSFYAHLETIEVSRGERVHRGTRLGSVGTAGGHYLAHLHFEMRDSSWLSIGAGYNETSAGRLNPEQTIAARRGADSACLVTSPALVLNPPFEVAPASDGNGGE